MLKALIVSNNHAYSNELKRSALLSNVEIIAECCGVEDVIRRLEGGMVPDVVIASDILFPGSTVEGLINVIRQANLMNRLYFVLRNGTYADTLMNQGIQFVYESNVTPQELLDMVKKGLESSGGNLSFSQLDNRTAEIQEIKNVSGRLHAEIENKRAAQRNQESEKRCTTYSNDSYSGALIKPVMVVVTSPKGGVGKTALSIELAHLLAVRGHEVDFNPTSKLSSTRYVNVCLVDLNPSFDTMAATLKCVRETPNYPTISDWISKIEEKIYNYLTPEEKRELMQDETHDFGPFIDENQIRFTREEVESLLVKDTETGLYLLPSIALPFDVEYVKRAYIRIILSQIRAMFDVVIVDTGNNISFMTTEALKTADEALIVATPTAGATSVVAKLLKNLDRIQCDKSKFSLVTNSPNGPAAELEPEMMAESLHLTLLNKIPFDEGVKMSHENGVAYAINHKKSPFTKEMVKLAQHICPLWTTVNVKSKSPLKMPGFFRR